MPRSRALTAGERRSREAAGEVVPGRALAQPPEDAAETIRIAAAGGASVEGIAVACGVGREVLSRWLVEYPALARAIAEGRERERRTLHNKLFRTATEGTGKEAMIAAMFLLKARHGYREGEQAESPSRVNITFNLPAAQPLAEFVEIENADGTEAKRLPAKAVVAAGRS